MLSKIYNLIPERVSDLIRKNDSFMKLINLVWPKKNGDFRESQVVVKQNYKFGTVEFNYLASVKAAKQAKERGIETKLLNNVFKLIEDNRGSSNDLIVLDIGANFGFLSCVFASTIAKRGSVFSFEPNPYVYESLIKTVKANRNFTVIITALNQAVGQNSGMVELNILGGTSNVLGNGKNKKSIPMLMTSIDDFISNQDVAKVDLVKIDVDGIEFEILEGGKNLFKRDMPMLIIETNGDERILKFCFDLGYRVYDMDLKEVIPTKNVIPHNIFCVNK